MKRRLKLSVKFLFIFLVLFCEGFYSPSVLADPPIKAESSQVEDNNGYDSFLRRMGFEDFSAELKNSLDQKNFLNKHISSRVLTYQSERLEMYNNARELAVEVLETLHTSNRSSASRDKIIEFTTRLLTTKPFQIDDRLPDRLKNDPDGAAEYLVQITRENIEKQSEILMADLIYTLYGKEKIGSFLKLAEKDPSKAYNSPEVKHLHELQKKVNKLVQFMYLDSEMGGFSVAALGKALVLGITRHQKLRGEDSLIKKLKASMENSGIYYANYVGRHLIVEGEKGTFKVEIRNGDHVFERSFGKQANEITAGVRPSGISNWLFARKLNLLGSVIGRNFHTEDDTIIKNPGIKEQIYKEIRETKAFTNGVSHAGIAEVLTDTETGMQTTRSWDSYVDEGEGGIRVTDILHQFARKSEFMRLVVSRFDSKKFAAYMQKYAQEVGYKEIARMGDHENKDKTVGKPSSVPWKTQISKEDFDKLVSLAATDPEAFAAEAGKRTVYGMREFHRQGLGFAKGFNNSYGRGYCSDIMFLDYLMYLGIDPLPTKDRWNYVVKLAKKMGMPGTEKIDTNRELIAPGAFIWQRELIDPNDIQVVDYPVLSAEEKIPLSFSTAEVAIDQKTYRDLITLKPFVKGAQDGSLEAAQNTLLTTMIDDAITIRGQYGKDVDVGDEHGRPRSSYLAQTDRLLRRVEGRSSKNPSSARKLSCPAVFKNK